MLNLKRAAKLGTLMAVTVGAIAAQVGAVPLPPGGSVATPGTTAAARPELAGGVIADVIRPFSVAVGGTVVQGWMQDRVVREQKNGTLDFYYRIQLYQNSNAEIFGIRRANFAPNGAPTDVDWRIDGLGQKFPKMASRTVDGSTISFYHGGAYAIFPGQQSRFVFVKTRATHYKLGGAQLVWSRPGVGGGVINLPAFQPAY